MNVRIDPSWNKELQDEWDKPYFAELTDFVRQQYQDSRQIVYPPASRIFAAFDECPFDKVKLLFSVRILITVQDRPTDCVSRWVTVLRCLHRSSIYLRRYRTILSFRCRRPMEICRGGHDRVCCCSTRLLPWRLIDLLRIRVKVGKHLPMK